MTRISQPIAAARIASASGAARAGELIAAMEQNAQQGAMSGSPMMLVPAAGAIIGNIMSTTLAVQASAINREEIAPFVAPFDFSIDQALFSVSTLLAGSARVVIYGADPATGRPTGLPTLSAAGSTSLAATVAAALAFTFEQGKQYWIGMRTSVAATLRVAATAHTLAWTNVATPVRQSVLRRTIAIDSAVAYPDWSNTLLASAMPPWIGMRIA